MAKRFSPREQKIFMELNELGYSQKSIAGLAGVSQATISRLLKADGEKKPGGEKEKTILK